MNGEIISKWKVQEQEVDRLGKEMNQEKQVYIDSLKKEFVDPDEMKFELEGLFSEIGNQLNVILRSGVTRSKVLKLSIVEYEADRKLYLTQGHGLKYPRLWQAWSPLGNYRNEDYRFEWINNQFKIEYKRSSDDQAKWENHLSIDFELLRNAKGLNQDKLEAFLKQFRIALDLKKKWFSLKSLKRELKALEKIHDLSTYSESSGFAEVLEITKRLGGKLKESQERSVLLKKEVDLFLAMLKEVNKPFRVLHTLKDTDG